MNLRIRVNKLESAANEMPGYFSSAAIAALMERVVGIKPGMALTDAMAMQFLCDRRSRGAVQQIVNEINERGSALPVVRSCEIRIVPTKIF